jgi:MerR family transcriptional regulator, copper efflux regulator
MRIGDAARLSGVSTRLIRYYESVGLLSTSGRDAKGYRIFEERNVHELRFIKRARSLDFPIKAIYELLNLWRDKRRPSRKVRALAKHHMQVVVSRIGAHWSIVELLNRLIKACKGDDRPDCPILDELSGGHTRQPKRKPRSGARPEETGSGVSPSGVDVIGSGRAS